MFTVVYNALVLLLFYDFTLTSWYTRKVLGTSLLYKLQYLNVLRTCMVLSLAGLFESLTQVCVVYITSLAIVLICHRRDLSLVRCVLGQPLCSRYIKGGHWKSTLKRYSYNQAASRVKRKRLKFLGCDG